MPDADLLRRLPAAIALAVAAVAAAVMILRPPGQDSAEAAARSSLEGRARSGTLRVVASRPWGKGVLIVLAYDDRRGGRSLAVGFAIDAGRGWRLTSSSAEQASPTDVVVGSLVVAAAQGGRSQPPWTAVYGELSEPRVAQLEVEWKDGRRTAASASRGGYLVARRGCHDPLSVRYLAPDGAELAKVPAAIDPPLCRGGRPRR